MLTIIRHNIQPSKPSKYETLSGRMRDRDKSETDLITARLGEREQLTDPLKVYSGRAHLVVMNS